QPVGFLLAEGRKEEVLEKVQVGKGVPVLCQSRIGGQDPVAEAAGHRDPEGLVAAPCWAGWGIGPARPAVPAGPVVSVGGRKQGGLLGCRGQRSHGESSHRTPYSLYSSTYFLMNLSSRVNDVCLAVMFSLSTGRGILRRALGAAGLLATIARPD